MVCVGSERNKLKCMKQMRQNIDEYVSSGRMYIGRPILDYNPDLMRQSRLSPRSSRRSSMSDFTDTTISTWNQRHPPPKAEYPSVLSDRLKIMDRGPFPRRIEFDTSNLVARGEPSTSTSYADNYRTSIQDRMETLSEQLTKVLSTEVGSSHINGSLADSGIHTDNTSTSVPQIYVVETALRKPGMKDASVDTRNENNQQEIPFIDEDDEDKWKRLSNVERHKSMSNIPERIEELQEHSSERLSNSLNRAKSPTFVEKFKKFFTDIGLVKADSAPNTSEQVERDSSTLPKSLNSSYRTRSATPTRSETRDASTLPKDMRFRKVFSSQTVYLRPDSPVLMRDQEIQTRKEHVSVVQLNGDESVQEVSSERVIKEIVYVKSLDKAEIYSGKDSGSTIIVVPPAD